MPINPPPADLTAAVLRLLPAVNAVTAAHQPNTTSGDPCPHCTPTSRPDCPHLWLAAAALDLVIRSRRLAGRCPACARGGTPTDTAGGSP